MNNRIKINSINNDKTISLGEMLESSFFKHQRLREDFHTKWTDSKHWEWIIRQYDLFLSSPEKKEIVPRTIHQIWIGSSIPKKYDMWRKSWMKKNPEYKYILWDENKILKMGLINEKQFMQAKNFGIKSDIARYEILYNYGGIYADTDFEAIKPVDSKLLSQSFVAGVLFDYKPQINNAFIISKPKCDLLKKVIHNISEYRSEMSGLEVLDYTGANYLSKIIYSNKFIKDILILPSQYLYPWPDFMSYEKRNPYFWNTNVTFAIHHWEGSWMYKSLLSRIFNKIKKIYIKKLN